ncbi:MAG: hypothetical protein MK116_12260 [Phycisphaerales bacterium]|nr:hypothetical protein [Phycisphaerales bacterium]
MNRNLPRLLKRAIPGLLIALLVSGARSEVVIEPARTVRLVGTDGESIRAEVSRLDREGLHGPGGTVPWPQVRPREVSQLWLSLMDRGRGQDWLDGAWVILVHPGATTRDRREADRFLGEASRLLEDGPTQVATLREAAAAHVAGRRERNLVDARRQRRQLGVEAGGWTATPWPSADQAALDARKERVRSLLQDQLGKAGDEAASGRMMTTRHFYLASDEPRTDLHGIGLELDHLISDLNSTFGRPLDDRPFAARAGVLVFSDPARRRAIENVAFEFPGQGDTLARVHVNGPGDGDVYLVIDASDLALARQQMRHEAVHAWMHRHRSPVRPPAWFNEGLAHAVAWWRVSPGDQDWRAEAVAHIRKPGYVSSLMAREYAPGTWTMTGVDTAVAGLLVRRLLEERRDQVIDWMDRMKRGEPAEAAFVQAFGAEVPEVLGRNLRYWELND